MGTAEISQGVDPCHHHQACTPDALWSQHPQNTPVSQKEKISSVNTYREKNGTCEPICMHSRNTDMDAENRCMDTKVESGGMNWEIGTGIHY